MKKPLFLKKIILIASWISLILFANTNSVYCAPGDMAEKIKFSGWASSKGVFGAVSGSLEDICTHIAWGALIGLGLAVASRVYFYINGPYIPVTVNGPEWGLYDKIVGQLQSHTPDEKWCQWGNKNADWTRTGKYDCTILEQSTLRIRRLEHPDNTLKIIIEAVGKLQTNIVDPVGQAQINIDLLKALKHHLAIYISKTTRSLDEVESTFNSLELEYLNVINDVASNIL